MQVQFGSTEVPKWSEVLGDFWLSDWSQRMNREAYHWPYYHGLVVIPTSFTSKLNPAGFA